MMTMPPSSPPSHIAAPGSRWPKLLGIIAVIFGVGSLFQGVIGPVSMLFVRQQMQAYIIQGADEARVSDYVSKITFHTYSSSAAAAAIGILLLTGGILLLRRRKVASPVLQIWAVLKIVVGGLVFFRSAALFRMQLEITLSSRAFGGGNEFGGYPTFISIVYWSFLIFGLLWTAALPLFMLIWLNREKAKQDMANW